MGKSPLDGFEKLPPCGRAANHFIFFSAAGNLLASGSDDLKVIIWDWSHQRPALVFDSGHRNNVFQAKFLPYSGDCHVVTCARDGQVRLAELSTTGVCKNTKKLAQHKGAAHKVRRWRGRYSVEISSILKN